MTQFNLTLGQNIEDNYQNGFLPQRNNSKFWYSDTSSRANLSNFQLSSENRRILNKTDSFNYQKIALKKFSLTSEIQKTIHLWIKQLEWDLPISSVKTIFSNHIFNYLYIWKDPTGKTIAYSICYFSKNISHIAYVFYNPLHSHSNLPIRLVLQTIIDSHNDDLKYCYLGRFSPTTGYYKRNMPGFEHFDSKTKQWRKYL